MTTPSDACPECGSGDLFWHCYDECPAKEHAVTCRACRTPFTTERGPDEPESA